MKERKVGKRFITKKSVVLEVTPISLQEGCDDCHYVDKPKCDKASCLSSDRKDHTEVYFKDVTDTLSDTQKIQLERGLLANCDVQK